MKRLSLLLGSLLLASAQAAVTTTCDHPAAQRAVALIAAAAPDGSDIRLVLDPTRRDDGYSVVREGRALVVKGARPRSFLYAAGEVPRWLGATGRFERKPAFALRMLNYTGTAHGVADWVAATGANAIELGRRDSPRWVKLCADADVPCYAFLYGCDPMKWDRAKCEAFLAAHPSAKGTDPGRSWEKGVMCPSDKYTWEFFSSYIKEVAGAGDYAGVAVTFWDDYGLNCHCKRCRAKGLDRFDAQVAAVVKCFEAALKPTGKKLLVRTWSSGCPHVLGDEWVHAPGYGGSGGEPLSLWGRTYKAAGRDTLIQTKVYNSDCQPAPPFSRLLGAARKAGFTEIAEWQITGQTLGLQWLPASVVDDTAARMKRARDLVGPKGGVCLYAGGYNNPGYEALDDVVNAVNIHAWRQLSWNPDDDVDAIWREWAAPRYGAAADAAVAALKRTERAAVASFSPLGLGAPTESRFAGTVSRREDLLRYTNRHYLPEGQAALAPTKENIARVVAEKDEALAAVEEGLRGLKGAEASTTSQTFQTNLEELALRLQWLKTHLIVSKALDGALWRCRYLRALRDMAASDPEALKGIEADFNAVRAHHRALFAHSPDLKLSCYGDAPVGDRDISLRSPVPLMRDIHSNAVSCVERILGPQ